MPEAARVGDHITHNYQSTGRAAGAILGAAGGVIVALPKAIKKVKSAVKNIKDAAKDYRMAIGAARIAIAFGASVAVLGPIGVLGAIGFGAFALYKAYAGTDKIIKAAEDIVEAADEVIEDATIGAELVSQVGETIGAKITMIPPTGNINTGAKKVIINGRFAAIALESQAHCIPPGKIPHLEIPPLGIPVAQGSTSVLIEGKPAARKGDMVTCAAFICEGSENVIIGGETVSLAKISDKADELTNNLQKGLSAAKDGINTSEDILGKVRDFIPKNPVPEDKIKEIFNQKENKSKLIPNSNKTTEGHPIDVTTGEMFTERVDFVLPGIIPIEWKCIWSSNFERSGFLGNGWHSPFEMSVLRDVKNDLIQVQLQDGRFASFSNLNFAEFTYNKVEKLFLLKTEYGYLMRDSQQKIYNFAFVDLINENKYLLTSIENFNGHKIVFDYDVSGNLIQIIDTVGRAIKFKYNQDNRISDILLPDIIDLDKNFSIVKYEYDSIGNLIECKDTLLKSFKYKYKEKLMVKETHKNGLNFYFEYDRIGYDAKCIRTWGDGNIYLRELRYENEKTTVKNGLGDIKIYEHKDGLVRKTIFPKGEEILKEYDENNWLMFETNVLGKSKVHQYDERGNCISILDGSGALNQMTFNQYELPIQMIDAVGGKTEWVYDESGNLIEEKDPLGRITTFKYINGWLAEIKNPLGAITMLGYDIHGNVNFIKTGDNQIYQASYDNLGRLIQLVDSNGNTTGRKLDVLGNVIESYEPDGNVGTYQYDAEGNVIRFKDKHRDVAFGYKGMNKLAYRIENGTRIDFQYDVEERLTAIINEQRSIYKFILDHNGNLSEEYGFDGLKRKYIRDKAGQVIEVQRPNNQRTNYQYDAVGRITSVSYNGIQKQSYTYRADGLLIEAKNDSIAVKFERDILGRLTKDIQGGYEVSSEYDLMDNRVAVRSSLGADLSIKRNIIGDVEEVWQKDLFTRFQRDNMGLEIEREFKGGVKSYWQRDSLGRPVKQDILVGGIGTRSRNYEWDVSNRLKEIFDSQRGKTTFEHDNVGNLAWAKKPDGSTDYRMPDAVGNLFRTKDQKDRRYGAAGQLLYADKTHYKYDLEGNLIEKVENGARTWKYEWNEAGHLARVIRPDRNTVEFEYDALGRRISKTFLGATIRWVWDGNTPLHEWIEPAEDKLRPVRADLPLSHGSLAAQNPFERKKNSPPLEGVGEVITWIFEPDSFVPLAKVVGNEQYGIISDHLGTPISMHHSNGETIWAADLDIYGKRHKQIGKVEECPFRYQGQYEDTETGLFYNRFRYYDPEGGNYISQDPIGLEGGNPSLYGYVYDTNICVDILGLKCKKTSYNGESRRDAFRQAKRDAGVPMNQQPNKINRTVLDDGQGNKILDSNGKPVLTRDYNFTNNKGENIIIQEHSLGHTKAVPNHGADPHFNVRPSSNPRTGNVQGTHGHYNFPKK